MRGIVHSTFFFLLCRDDIKDTALSAAWSLFSEQIKSTTLLRSYMKNFLDLNILHSNSNLKSIIIQREQSKNKQINIDFVGLFSASAYNLLRENKGLV